MELPRLIVIGNKNLGNIGKFLHSLNEPKKVSVISGRHVKKIIQTKFQKSLLMAGIKSVWHNANNNDETSIDKIQNDVKKDGSDLIIGIGGGRSVDIAKMISFNLEKPFVSVPTAASHDGI
ncbi:MAG: iron-containing alcohol dehydrogenase, partial [Nitrososphaerales archaeon]